MILTVVVGLKNIKIVGSLTEGVETSHIAVFPGSLLILDGLDISETGGDIVEAIGDATVLITDVIGQVHRPLLVVRQKSPPMARTTQSILEEELGWRWGFGHKNSHILQPRMRPEPDKNTVQDATAQFWKQFAGQYTLPELIDIETLGHLITKALGPAFSLEQEKQRVASSLNYRGNPNHIEYWVMLKIALQHSVPLPKDTLYQIRQINNSSIRGALIIDGENLQRPVSTVDVIAFSNSRLDSNLRNN